MAVEIAHVLIVMALANRYCIGLMRQPERTCMKEHTFLFIGDSKRLQSL
jgi:hypothetical protein